MSRPNWSGTQTPFSAPTVVLVLVFGICWAPFHIERLMWSFVSHWTDCLRLAYKYVHVISGVFFYLSSAVNPVLYSLMSSRFQDTFREALCLGTRCRGHRRRHSSRSLSRVTTGSTLCDMGSLGSRAHPLAESYGPEGQQEADPSLHRGASKQLHLEAPEGHLQSHLPSSSCLSPLCPVPTAGTSVTPAPNIY